ncbi:proline iminopeptidase-family hydrolase [Kitasatospora phosalacinea]|uniref:Proline iminopeptidase n=1 Tax=Kitasatospora phosalacinea TaxID=2065 RepID=A0A9W6URW8_9ACTN|nr:proline iminopeptidase-family hydrolase [Kitasatospora phosalacinea]GLW58799.1 proline iminopeptidase [Kitasatospora phosalacinea]
MDVAEGTVPFGEYRTWYRMTGTPGAGRPVVVVAHGGPGSTHHYLANLAELARSGWPVLHYDQLGNGGSTHLPDEGADFWVPGLFEAELDNLLRALGADEDYVLFGHSWGGLLVARHAARQPPGLRGLVIADSPASYPLWRREMAVLRAALPPGVDETLRRHEEAGTTASHEYYKAVRVFYDRHVCRVVPWPRDYRASFLEMSEDTTVYSVMNGPSEFHVTGTLKDWSVEDCLPDVDVPTLLVSGRYDEATPVTVQPYFDLVPDVRWEVFEESSHVPNLEEPERFRAVLVEFLEGLA